MWQFQLGSPVCPVDGQIKVFPCTTWQLIPAPGSPLKRLPTGTCASYSDRFPKGPLTLLKAADLHWNPPERQNSRYGFTGSIFLPALILAMDFWHFWLHSSSLPVWPLQKRTHSFLHTVFLQFLYVKNLTSSLCCCCMHSSFFKILSHDLHHFRCSHRSFAFFLECAVTHCQIKLVPENGS